MTYIKNIPAIVLGYFTADSWRLATIGHRKAKIEQDYQLKIDQLTTINYNNEIDSSLKQIKYQAIAGRIKESNDEITKLNSVYDRLSSRFSEAGLNPNEKTQLLTDMK